MKKAYVLYRALDNNEIREANTTVQKTVCRDFAALKGWTIVKEFEDPVGITEPGSLQVIRDDALEGLFDFLLVYKFDLLGREPLETPFIVEFLVSHGIETWGALEGKKRFDEEVAFLLNVHELYFLKDH